MTPRIIPAYAGNTAVKSSGVLESGDHPRVCGEHRTNLAKTADRQGSSPRMRGTRTISAIRTGCTGIIPAYAGNTCVVYGVCTQRGDHPRVCGEHHRLRLSRIDYRGSSPRMRGTHGWNGYVARILGIIPAYAGNTWTRSATPTPPRDHPRVCGEHRPRSARRR